jgi:arylsulfatase A-like enzyme
MGQAGRWQSEYHDAMIDHDKWVGDLLQHLDDLGIAEDTIVIYGTDNGPHMNSWPDAGMTPFRNEKDSNWEGAFRVPWIVRWPGVIQPRSVCNQIISNLDWLPTCWRPPASPTSRRSSQGPQDRRSNLQGASRRLQLPALLQGREEGESAGRILLLLRRRRFDGDAL